MAEKIISLTGTPGTGKTTISEKLEDDYEVLHLTEFIKQRGIGGGVKPIEVDIEELREEFEKHLNSKTTGKVLVVEGHLSHYLDTDYCIVLRTEPEVLRERLEKRDYDEKKINENVESERIDYIMQESLSNFEKLYEIDNTKEKIGEVAEELKTAIETEKTGFGDINWL